MSPGKISASPVATVAWPKAADRTARTRAAALVAAIGEALRRWRTRQRLRRELAQMSPRDFGDLAVPPSLIKDELGRAPWREPSPQWRWVARRTGGGDDVR